MKRVIETPRLLLRELEDLDAPFILALVNDPLWLKYIGDRNIRDEQAALAYINDGPRNSYKSHGFGLLLITDRESGRPYGMCGLLKRDYLTHPDIGYALVPAARGKGYALESAKAVLALAKETGHTRIDALVMPENTSSIELLLALGMTEIGEISTAGVPPSKHYSIALEAARF